MSGKSEKRLRRSVRKETDKIKMHGLKQFMEYTTTQPLKKRIKFAAQIIFKKGEKEDDRTE